MLINWEQSIKYCGTEWHPGKIEWKDNYRDNIHDLERTSTLRHMILKKLLIPFNLLRAFLLAQISNESSRQINAYQNRHFTCDLKSARNKRRCKHIPYKASHTHYGNSSSTLHVRDQTFNIVALKSTTKSIMSLIGSYIVCCSLKSTARFCQCFFLWPKSTPSLKP